jgi:hypothetical protein
VLDTKGRDFLFYLNLLVFFTTQSLTFECIFYATNLGGNAINSNRIQKTEKTATTLRNFSLFYYIFIQF